MRIRPLPKSWLIHTITYEQFLNDTDDYGNPLYAEPVTINFVRYDPTTVFSRDNTQTKIVAEGVIFVDSVNSTLIPDFVEQSKIIFDDREMVLKKIVPCYHPQLNEIHHYELEVI